MVSNPFYFELSSCLKEFARAFNDVIIDRYNQTRVAEQKVPVRLIYSPKMRVLYDLVNTGKNNVLPVISFNVTGYSIDKSRIQSKHSTLVFNKTNVRMPVPVDISLSVSIHAKYQMDVDQILSNLISSTNPYLVVSWVIPKEFLEAGETPQEIRSQVEWSGSWSLSYNLDKTPDDKSIISADTSFTFKSWIFPRHEDSAPIYKAVIGMADRDVTLPLEILTLSGNPTTKEIVDDLSIT